jgi:hypothetical protein
MKQRNNEEEIEQRKVVEYLDYLKRKYQDPITFKQDIIKFTAIPNSTSVVSKDGKKNYAELTKNTLDGVRAGLPDLFIIINQQAFFIEMKREIGGVVSDKQKKWIEAINQTTSLKAYVCKGFQEAKKIVDSYIFVN